MIDHGKCVASNSKNALTVIDMPFGSYEGDKIKVDTVKGNYKERYKE